MADRRPILLAALLALAAFGAGVWALDYSLGWDTWGDEVDSDVEWRSWKHSLACASFDGEPCSCKEVAA